MVGKYVDYADSYKSLNEALTHAGIHTETKVVTKFIDASEIEEKGTGVLEGLDAILVPGGFGKRGTEGMIKAIEYARMNNIPFLGICLGMQMAVIEFARHVCGLGGANSTELEPDTAHPVVALITEWKDRTGSVQKRDESSDLGGTMRLGRQEVPVKPGTLAHKIYGDVVAERHRHRYEVNNAYVQQFEDKGLVFSARTPSENLPEMMELPGHPFFFAMQFHPESRRIRVSVIRSSRPTSRPRLRTPKPIRRRNFSLRTRGRLQKLSAGGFPTIRYRNFFWKDDPSCNSADLKSVSTAPSF